MFVLKFHGQMSKSIYLNTISYYKPFIILVKNQELNYRKYSIDRLKNENKSWNKSKIQTKYIKMLYFLIFLAKGINISLIPKTGPPPSESYETSAVYDSVENQIIVFGGWSHKTDEYLSRISTYSLTSNLWGELSPESSQSPPGLTFTRLYLRSDRNLFVFFGQKATGQSSDIFCFNLETLSWSVITLSGDPISGRSNFGFASFSSSSGNYVAVFGGITDAGIDNNLYL